MAYSIKNDSYTCDFCNFEMGWEQKDDVHGEMWGCEKCGDNFCSKCFIDRYGKNEYMKMMQNFNQIYCPKCWEKHKNEPC